MHVNTEKLESLLNETMAAQAMGLTIRTLQSWRVAGKGPPFIRISARAIRYRMLDIENWLNERRKISTSQY